MSIPNYNNVKNKLQTCMSYYDMQKGVTSQIENWEDEFPQ